MSKGITSVNHYPATHKQVRVLHILCSFPFPLGFIKLHDRFFFFFFDASYCFERLKHASHCLHSLHLAPIWLGTSLIRALHYEFWGMGATSFTTHHPRHALQRRQLTSLFTPTVHMFLSRFHRKVWLNERLSLEPGWCREEKESWRLATAFPNIKQSSKIWIHQKSTCPFSILSYNLCRPQNVWQPRARADKLRCIRSEQRWWQPLHGRPFSVNLKPDHRGAVVFWLIAEMWPKKALVWGEMGSNHPSRMDSLNLLSSQTSVSPSWHLDEQPRN